MGCYHVVVFKFDPKCGIGQGVDDLPLHFNLIFFCHRRFPWWSLMLKPAVCVQRAFTGHPIGKPLVLLALLLVVLQANK
jgi:hypothetical protein